MSDESTLSEIGITRNQSSQWQKLADITPDNFHHAMNEALQKGDQVGALRIVEIAKQKAKENPLPPQEIARIRAARAAEGEAQSILNRLTNFHTRAALSSRSSTTYSVPLKRHRTGGRFFG